MIKISQVVIVEGRYDKIRLSGFLDALIIPTGGYRIFKDKEALGMIRELAIRHGLIIMTDSDTAGFRIRRYLGGAVPVEHVTHVYLPQIKGKERRKRAPSAEGYLGVEGLDATVILEALRKAGVSAVQVGGECAPTLSRPVTKADFVQLGLSGAPDSAARRSAVLQDLGMPTYLSANAMIGIINATMGYDEFARLVNKPPIARPRTT